MTIRFPNQLDGEDNLFVVHDGLRLVLSVDYQPGDTTITVEGDAEIFNRFPTVGLLTLTEQCSEPELRAISFSYTGKGDMTFTGCQILSCFTDSFKPRRLTNVLQNVMAEHHNILKDALIAIQRFAGVRGETARVALDGTMEARINFLRRLVLAPTAWFNVNRRVGVVPLCVELQDFSTRFPDRWDWDFGDGTTASVIRSASVLTGTISKCYYLPGVYPVTLKVQNSFGENEVTIQEFITARVIAPDLASIDFVPTADQILSGGVIRTRVDRPVEIQVTDAGEQPFDPVVRIVYDLQDDLQHDTSLSTKAQYSVGGTYDVKVRAETALGAYRVTAINDSIDVVEGVNIWHFIFPPPNVLAVTKTSSIYEFGLLSEMYKAAMPSSITATRDYRFLSGMPSETLQQQEFLRNNGFAPRSLVGSGDGGDAMVFWAEGAVSSASSQSIRFREFNGFDELVTVPNVAGGGDTYTRFWNWLPLVSPSQVHFVFGLTGPYPQPAGSPTSDEMDTLFLSNLAVDTTTFAASDFLNGAIDLTANPGGGTDGDFSTYRGAWKDASGYFVRNDGSGTFYRLKSFYRTESAVLGIEVDSIRKLPDMVGVTKAEGRLVSLSRGLFFFNNTGEVVAYDPVTNLWASNGQGANSPAFAPLQDFTVTDYNDPANPLIGVSDGNHRAYLFYDYSANANLSYNDIDQTFRRLPSRPTGEQFLAGLY